MRIALVGGDPRYLLNFRGELAAALVRRGHSVVAVAGGDVPEVRAGLRALGATFEPYPLDRRGTHPVGEARSFARLAGVLRRSRPDLVLAFSPKVIVYASLAARMAGIPRTVALVTGLGTAFTDTGSANQRRNRVVRLLLGAALRTVRLAIFQNADDRDELRRTGVLPRRCRTALVAGSGVPLDRFVHVPPETAGPPRFLLVARLQREKGIYEYAEAARILRDRGTRATFRLVGPIDDHPAAIDPADLGEWTAAGLVEWQGPVEDVAPYLRDCTVFVLPSYREGTPRSVLEALATGRAIVTTDVPGCRETVEHERNGLLVRSRSGASLAAALQRFADEPSLAASMGLASRRLAERVFDVRRVNADMIRLIESA